MLLKAEKLCKSYASDGVQNHALKNIDIEIGSGEFTVVMGPSGSGKSTLLYCLSVMDKATSGSLYYGGRNLSILNDKEMAKLRRHEFGFVFQQIHLVPDLTLFENIAVPGYLTMKAGASHKRSDELLSQVGLEGLGKRLPTQVSGGQAQRAAVARALVNSPKVLFADEPTGSLNSKAGQEILDLLTSLNQNGQTTLMVTHDVKAAARAGRLLFLKDGVIGDEMILPRYDKGNTAGREAQLVAWLTSLGW
jgi:putative ABC transport system ATP-binding protein